MRITGVTSFLTLALSGCASLTPPGKPSIGVDVPANWSTGSGSVTAVTLDSAAWWRRFQDPLLAELVAQAMRSNRSLASGSGALREARALRDAARATLLPLLSGSFGAQRGTTVGGSRTTGNSFSAGLDASWDLDIFGANRSAYFVSDALTRGSVASLGDIQVQVTAEVALDYITIRDSQARLAIASANLANQEDTLQIARWREQAGLATLLETEQARAQTEQTRAQLPLLHTAIEQFSHALAVLTGQAPLALSSALARVSPVPHADSCLALGIPADTLRQRPDVRAAEQQVRASIARVSQAKAARAPDFSLGGSLSSEALSIGGLGSSASVVKAIAASVVLPLIDGGARRAQVRAQLAALEQAQSAYEAAILAALQQVEDALVALRDDVDRSGSLYQALGGGWNTDDTADTGPSSGNLARFDDR